MFCYHRVRIGLRVCHGWSMSGIGKLSHLYTCTYRTALKSVIAF